MISFVSEKAPAETVKEFENYVHVNNRTKFAAMVAELDRSVGRIVRALQDKDLLKDTLIVFSSDNGGQNIGPLSNVGECRFLDDDLHETFNLSTDH